MHTTASLSTSQKQTGRHIIDTTWGPGPPLDEKLAIFNAYTNVITENNCMVSIGLGIDPMGWDSIKKSYRAQY